MFVLPSVVLGCCLLWLPTSRAGEVRAYCQWETFNATCPPGQVVLMTSALYGRMEVSRCIQVDYYKGCHSDVLDHADERCSGQRNCSIKIPDATMYNVQPCRKDLAAYFSAAYDCVPVINPLLEKKTYCRNTLDISQHQEGYIASSVTAETNLGSERCPWKIVTNPGQKINITLMDFSTYSATPTESSSSVGKFRSASRDCPVHAVLIEGSGRTGKVGSPTKQVKICSSPHRRRWVHITSANTLWVQLINITKENNDNIRFLLHYEATGCADIKPMPHARIEREGESMKISCNFTQETWHLVCKGTKWIGEYYNCSSAHRMKGGQSGEEGFPLVPDGDDNSTLENQPPARKWKTLFGGSKVFLQKENTLTTSYRLLIAIAIGVVVGVVLGFVFLIGIFVCRKRVRQEGKHDSGNPLMGAPPVDSDPQNIYRLVEVRPPASMMCDCQYTPGLDHKSLASLDNTMLMPSPPGECIYRTTPRMDPGECHYQSRDGGDTYQPQKTCDIISDIHVPEKLSCCDGPDWYTRSQQGDTYPRIAPFPGFNRQDRGSVPNTRNNGVPSSHDSGTVADLYEPTTGPANTSTFQAT